MEECIFCKIIAGEIPSIKLYEDEKTIAFLDIYPVAKAHTLIIPKNHSATLYDISIEDAQAVNVYQANEKAAMQEIFHVHFHVIPRFEDDEIVFMAQKTELDEDKQITEALVHALK